MKLFILLSFLLSFLLPTTLFAREFRMNQLQSQLDDVPLRQRCATCHGGGSNPKAFNAFGKDYIALFVFKPSDPVLLARFELPEPQKWAILLDQMDSNKNGESNRNDIAAGVNPGITQ